MSVTPLDHCQSGVQLRRTPLQNNEAASCDAHTARKERSGDLLSKSPLSNCRAASLRHNTSRRVERRKPLYF